MPQYCFKCASRKHPEGSPRVFSAFIHLEPADLKAGRLPDHYPCPVCKMMAPRAMEEEIPTQSLVGMKTISESTTVKGSLYHAAKFAFQGDGLVIDSKGKPILQTVGDFQKFLDGQNELGPPVVDDRGNPVRRSDGSIVRRGEKFVKLDGNKAPASHPPRRLRVEPQRTAIPDAYIDPAELPIHVPSGGRSRSGSRPPDEVMNVLGKTSRGVYPVPTHVSPKRLPRNK